MVVSDKLSNNYVQILAQLKIERAKNCTQAQMAKNLNVSLRKYVDFEAGKTLDFALLDQVAGIFAKDIVLLLN